MKVTELIQDFTDKKISNTKIAPTAVEDYLKETLEIKTYIPFRDKRAIVEAVVQANITEENGIKKIDKINQYIGFVVSMLKAHTILDFESDPVADYDLLAKSGLLPQIIAQFKESYDEFQVLLNLCVQNELEDNNVNVTVGKFLNGILSRLDNLSEVFKDKIGDVNIKDILNSNFKEENLAKLSGFLNTYIK